MGSSYVRSRHDHSLVTYQLETTLSTRFQRNALMAYGNSRVRSDCGNLSVCVRGDATLYLFPVLI